METGVVLVGELQGLPVHIDELDFVGRTKADIGAFPGPDVANDRLHKCPQVSRRAMLQFEHDGDVAVVLNCLSFSEIVRCCHRVELLRTGVLQPTALQSNLSFVRSCESMMPTGTR